MHHLLIIYILSLSAFAVTYIDGPCVVEGMVCPCPTLCSSTWSYQFATSVDTVNHYFTHCLDLDREAENANNADPTQKWVMSDAVALFVSGTNIRGHIPPIFGNCYLTHKEVVTSLVNELIQVNTNIHHK